MQKRVIKSLIIVRTILKNCHNQASVESTKETANVWDDMSETGNTQLRIKQRTFLWGKLFRLTSIDKQAYKRDVFV